MFWGAEMITHSVYDEARISAPGVVERDRATLLFNAVLSSVKLNPTQYETLIGTLGKMHGACGFY